MILTACLVGSAVVHAATLTVLALYQPEPREQLTDVASDETFTTLTLAPLAPDPGPAQPPPPPEQRTAPPPQSEPKPEPKPEPRPEPTPVAKVEPPRAIIAYTPVPPPREDAPARSVRTTAAPAASGARGPQPASDESEGPRGTSALFAGVRAKGASRIVYAVDASGAMASSLPFVLDEVMRSVNRLAPSQKFQVVLFRESPDGSGSLGPLIFASTLVPATDENRSKLAAWLHSAQPAGRSNPLSGLEPALSYEPDLIFLLTRSIKRSGPQADWGPGNRAVLQRLEQLNPRDTRNARRVVIKTIQFLDADPTGLLQAIADSHGDGSGSSRTLKLEDLEER